MRRATTAALLAIALAMSGCTNPGSATSAGIDAATSAGVGAGVGIDVAVKYAERRVHGHVQDAVALAAEPLAVGQSAHWNDEYWLPLDGKQGTVEVARSFGKAIPCKDIVFTVDKDDNLYVAVVCADKKGAWRWALAEPTVDRWGSLQ